MGITHELLLSLGFTELFNRPNRYVYKGVTGRLHPDIGIVYFHGFSPPIADLPDLRYILKLIDYQHQATVVSYPTHYN